MLGQRIATALVLLAILLPAIFLFDPVVWGVVTLILLAIGAWEWTRLLGQPDRAVLVAVLTMLIGGALLWWRTTSELPGAGITWVAGALTLFWIIEGTRRLRVGSARGGGWPLALLLLLGCWWALFELRLRGPMTLLSGMAIVWVADIGAYFVGRAFGRRKLAPTISPGKSWEGAVGGALAVVAIASVLALVPGLADTMTSRLVAGLSVWWAAVLLIGVAALSIVGDLHESLLKRQAGCKDSGRILPGHGGVLDRIDALIPAMPAVLWIDQLLR